MLTACLAALRSLCLLPDLLQPGTGPHLFRLSRLRQIGGADRDRTDDPLLAKQMLSQLSYSPFGSRFVAGGN